MKSGSWLLETGLIAVLTLAPVLFGSVYSWAAMAWTALLFLLLFLHPGALLNLQNLPRMFRGGMVCLFAFILIQVLFVSLGRYATAYEGLLWLGLGSGFLLIQLLPVDSVVKLASACVLIGTLESLYGFFQILSGHEKILWQAKEAHLGFLTGTYLNRNHLAGLLELALGVSAGFWLSAIQGSRRQGIFLFGFSSLTILAGLLWTGSRTGILCAGILTVLFVLFSEKGSFKFSFPRLLILLILFAAALWFSREIFLSRFLDPDDRWIPWQSKRWLVWKDALAILRDHPWFGTGLGTFEWIFPAYQSEKLSLGWAHAHQDYLELAVELGLPAFGLMIVSWSGLFWSGLSKFKNAAQHLTPLVLGIYLSLGVFLLHGWTDFNFAIPANALWFVFLAAMSHRLVRG